MGTGPGLHAVPETPPRVLGVVRVSKEREGMVSPEIQDAAIETYCAARGYEITGRVEGIDESGSRARSAWWPTLERAVAAVEEGEYDVLVVWKFSRIARHRLRWAAAIDRVEAAGGRIESATEQFDTSTSSGRLARGMLGELNAFMAEQIGESWKEAHARRVRSGKPASGKDRYGYRYDRDQKLHVPDPVTGPLLADMYRRYLAGESFFALIRWLNTHGHHAPSGSGLWTDTALRRVMDSGFGSGQFMSYGELLPGVHEPLIDMKTWQAYLDSRETRRALPSRRERSQYLLSGLIGCARCKGPMTAGQFGAKHEPKYRCATSKTKGPEACAGGYVLAKFVEQTVFEWLQGLAKDADQAHEAALLVKARRTAARADASRLRREIVNVEATLGRIAMQHAEHPLPPAVYQKAHGELTVQLQGLEAALERANLEQRQRLDNPKRAAAHLLKRWETAPVAYRRTELATLLRRVEVMTGRPRATFEIIPTWET